jgi:RNA polymerase-binding transcription factor DksA
MTPTRVSVALGSIRRRTEDTRAPCRPAKRWRYAARRGSGDEDERARQRRNPDRAFADEVDQIQVSVSRDIGLVTRELLQERANRLSAALDRLHEGAYGVCVECAQRIAPARLQAVPEVDTCVRCQAGLERLGHPAGRSRRSVFAAGEHGAASEASQASYRSSLFPNEEDRDAMR